MIAQDRAGGTQVSNASSIPEPVLSYNAEFRHFYFVLRTPHQLGLSFPLLIASLPITLCFHRPRINSLLPRTPIIAFMDGLSPPKFLALILNVLDRGEVVLVLLHSRNPRHVVESHDLEAEVLVVLDLLDGREERVEVGSGLVVDVG